MQTAIIIISLFLSVICFMCIHLKTYNNENHLWDGVKRVIIPGLVIGVLFSALVVRPITIENMVISLLLWVLTGEVIYISYLIAKSTWKEKKATAYYDDGTPTKYYITGDKHRNFAFVKDFCREINTRRKDVLIILGDAGFNYFGDVRDEKLKKEMSNLNITLFCIHGNKENRPQNVGTYGVRSFCGGKVYYEPKYPNILFAIDGEIYTFEGKKYMVIGGAHSVDKMYCLQENKPFWEDEIPNDKVKTRVEEQLESMDKSIYGMMTHTCPIDYLPTEMFVSTRQNAAIKRRLRRATPKKRFKPDVDRSTEEWLGSIEKNLNYNVWFCGHYHVDKQLDKVNMLYNEIRPLHMYPLEDNNDYAI